MIEIGAYRHGTNQKIDEAIRMQEQCNSFLRQGIWEKFSFQETQQLLEKLFPDEEQN